MLWGVPGDRGSPQHIGTLPHSPCRASTSTRVPAPPSSPGQPAVPAVPRPHAAHLPGPLLAGGPKAPQPGPAVALMPPPSSCRPRGAGGDKPGPARAAGPASSPRGQAVPHSCPAAPTPPPRGLACAVSCHLAPVNNSPPPSPVVSSQVFIARAPVSLEAACFKAV